MTPLAIEACCLAQPGAVLSIQWGGERVFKVGGKMFAVLGQNAAGGWRLSFKCSDLSFRILTEQPGLVPAPYLARAQWVACAVPGPLPADELRAYLLQAYCIVRDRLPKAVRRAIADAE